MAVLLCVLAIVTLVLYLNQIGVPDFVQERVELELRRRGLNVQLGRVRMRGLHELAARNIQLGPTGQTNGARLLIPEAELRLNFQSLARLEFKLESAALRKAQLVWPVTTNHAPAGSLSIDDISTELLFTDPDQWDLTYFDSEFLGTHLHFSASVTNASALRSWASKRKRAEPFPWQEILNRWGARLQQVRLPTTSVLWLRVTGDARQPAGFRADLKVHTASAETPWGEVKHLSLKAGLLPGSAESKEVEANVDLRFGELQTLDRQWRFGSNHLSGLVQLSATNQNLRSARFDCTLATAETRWARGTNIHLLTLTQPANGAANAPLKTVLRLEAGGIASSLLETRTNQLAAEVVHSMTNFTAIDGQWQLEVQKLATRWGQTESVNLTGHVASPNLTAPGPADATWGPWSLIDTLRLDWEFQLGSVRSPELRLDSLHCAGDWRPPLVRIQRLQSGLYGGQLEASALLDVSTRELTSDLAFDFDVRQIDSLLTAASRRWLSQFTWTTPPHVTAQAGLVLPIWTNSHPKWREEVLPTVALAGRFEGTSGTFRKIPVSGADSHFTLTNLVWHLPDLSVRRPEGGARLDYTWDMRTHAFAWGIEGRVDLTALKPVLGPAELRGLEMFQFTAPPEIRGEIWGRWMRRDTIGFRGEVAATNFTFRGERCDRLDAHLSFTNLVLAFTNAQIVRDGRHIKAPAGAYDIGEGVIRLTNAVSTMDPGPVTKVMGPKIHHLMQPYHFSEPPTVRVNGRVPVHDIEKADLRFEIAGGGFDYWKFKLPNVSGKVLWRGQYLAVTNVQATFYKGQLLWAGEFDFIPAAGADFRFRGSVKDADLRSLMADLSPTTNRLEGVLNGNVVVTSANSENWKTWQGFGDVNLRDGFLWNIPIFGFLSPMLNKVVPGLGQSRASAASATFVMDKSVIRTSDLEVRSAALRLQYDGSVDFKGAVDAKMQAEILRDAWAVGRVVSLALWPLTKVFEYKISGTLAEPKSEPLYIPRLFFFPFHPVKTLRDIFTETEPNNPAKDTPRN